MKDFLPMLDDETSLYVSFHRILDVPGLQNGMHSNFTSLNPLNHVTHRPKEAHRTTFDSNHPQIAFESAHRGREHWSIESISSGQKINENSPDICIECIDY